ncbi:MAG: flavodoxin [Lachnospiraceae bacterium]|nr:flavodoxin [Lachnospiraceae bacterium]
MAEVKVVYWSGTGNTAAMAEAVIKGVNEGGATAVPKAFDGLTVDEVAGDSVIVFGCPAMGAEVLEESVVEPFMAEFEAVAAGKKVALFGSYGWGDGEWMRSWEERIVNAGATLINDAGVMANEAPDEEALANCEALGKAAAAAAQ